MPPPSPPAERSAEFDLCLWRRVPRPSTDGRACKHRAARLAAQHGDPWKRAAAQFIDERMLTYRYIPRCIPNLSASNMSTLRVRGGTAPAAGVIAN